MMTLVTRFRGTEEGIKLFHRGPFQGMFTLRCLVVQPDNVLPADDVIALSSFRNIGWRRDPLIGTNAITSLNLTTVSEKKSTSAFLSRFRPRSLKSSHVESTGSSTSDTTKDFLGIEDLEKQYRRFQRTMNSWHMSDKDVMVLCNVFVLSAVGIFLLIVVVGLVILFTFRKGISGVDRSNILIFLWTIAVFGIGLSKSWYTNDWTWHDFIHRQLPCKGVQELSRVTGVDEQIILMYLLRKDNKQFYTTGEYNSLFQRRAPESQRRLKDEAAKNNLHRVDGFAIDCPLKLSTLLACGFLVFMVEREDGVYLVCIGGKKTNESMNYKAGGKRLVCKAPKVEWNGEGQGRAIL